MGLHYFFFFPRSFIAAAQWKWNGKKRHPFFRGQKGNRFEEIRNFADEEKSCCFSFRVPSDWDVCTIVENLTH